MTPQMGQSGTEWPGVRWRCADRRCDERTMAHSAASSSGRTPHQSREQSLPVALHILTAVALFEIDRAEGGHGFHENGRLNAATPRGFGTFVLTHKSTQVSDRKPFGVGRAECHREAFKAFLARLSSDPNESLAIAYRQRGILFASSPRSR